jgi:aconitase B
VLNYYTLDVTAAPSGAAFPGAGSPWANLSAAGASHVRMPNPVPAAFKGAEARLAAFRQIPAMAAEQLAAKATGLPAAIQNRKHNVYKTRVNAGGDGASGPHPEREPA